MLDWIQDSTLYAAIDANQSTFLAYKSGRTLILEVHFNAKSVVI
jgi:hypothetical protein